MLDKDSTQVLLIEDDSVQITLIETLLLADRRDRFAVETAKLLSAARERLETGGIAVILLDLGLPDSQGIQTVRMLHECAHSVPIIVLTGSDDEDLALEALKNGAQDYLVKGAVDGPSLARSIRYAIQRCSGDEHRRRLQLLMDGIPDLRIYFKDREGRFIDVNTAFARNYGFNSPQKLIGKTDFDLFSSEHAEAAREDEQMVIRTGRTIGGKVEKETNPDGTTRWALTTKMPLRGEEGRIIGTCGILRDITAGLKQAEEHLVVTNAGLTNLLAGFAFDIKHPLFMLDMGIGYLGELLPAGDQSLNDLVTGMKGAVHRGIGIVRDVLHYSVARDLTLEEVALDSLINGALRLVSRELAKSKVDVITRLSEDLPTLHLDATKIQQVLVNVFINACHAMPNGGALNITTGQKVVEADEPEDESFNATGLPFYRGEKLAVIEICDTGPGIPEGMLRCIFDPFFTNKAKGTGLGLSVVKKIIELHGGRISIANRTEGGAQVTILLKSEP